MFASGPSPAQPTLRELASHGGVIKFEFPDRESTLSAFRSFWETVSGGRVLEQLDQMLQRDDEGWITEWTDHGYRATVRAGALDFPWQLHVRTYPLADEMPARVVDALEGFNWKLSEYL